MGPCPSIKLGLTLEVLSLLGMGTGETGGVWQALQGKGGSEGRDRRHTMGAGGGVARAGVAHVISSVGLWALPLCP